MNARPDPAMTITAPVGTRSTTAQNPMTAFLLTNAKITASSTSAAAKIIQTDSIIVITASSLTRKRLFIICVPAYQQNPMKRRYSLTVFLFSLTVSLVFSSALVLFVFGVIDRRVNPPDMVGPGYTDYGMGMLMFFVGLPAIGLVTAVCTWLLNRRLNAIIESKLS
jgi:hypothetical protein